MRNTGIKATLTGFIGGVAFIIGCGGSAGGGATNNAVANTTSQVQDIEEQYCYVDMQGDGLYKEQIHLFFNNYVSWTEGTTPLEQHPNLRVYCASYADLTYTETSLEALQQGRWKTYHASTSKESYSKMWRSVVR